MFEMVGGRESGAKACNCSKLFHWVLYSCNFLMNQIMWWELLRNVVSIGMLKLLMNMHHRANNMWKSTKCSSPSLHFGNVLNWPIVKAWCKDYHESKHMKIMRHKRGSVLMPNLKRRKDFLEGLVGIRYPPLLRSICNMPLVLWDKCHHSTL
jgi:hypothetical protein